jgi:hypothetical protein
LTRILAEKADEIEQEPHHDEAVPVDDEDEIELGKVLENPPGQETPLSPVEALRVEKAVAKVVERMWEEPEPEPRPKREPREPREPRQAKHTRFTEPEDEGLRDITIQRLLMEVDTFHAIIKPIVPDAKAFCASLQKRSTKDLVAMLSLIQSTRRSANLTNQFRSFFYMGANMAESFGGLAGLKTKGIVDAFQSQREDIDLILRELAIDYSAKFQKLQRPELRLALIVSMSLFAIDAKNRDAETDHEAEEAIRSAEREVEQRNLTANAQTTTAAALPVEV